MMPFLFSKLTSSSSLSSSQITAQHREPATGCQKKIEITDENKLRVFYDKRISAEVEANSLGDEWKGYIFKIMGGNDKQGFGMKQGVLTNQRVFLLQVRGTQGFQGHGRRKGERRRKACRGASFMKAGVERRHRQARRRTCGFDRHRSAENARSEESVEDS